MMSPVKQTIAIHILPNISRSKKVIRLSWSVNKNITWEMFFLKNHAQNMVEKLFPDPFLKNQYQYISISLDQ